MSILALRLKKARIRAGLKQVQVYEKTGINNKTLSGYENGVSEPDAKTLRKLAELYEVSIDWLMDNDEHGFVVPESDFDNFVKLMEEQYNVNLSDDLVLHTSLRQLVEAVARAKSQHTLLLHG